jgi:hypothetical protein
MKLIIIIIKLTVIIITTKINNNNNNNNKNIYSVSVVAVVQDSWREYTALASVQDSWNEFTQYWHQFKTPGVNSHGIGTSSRLLE